MPKPRVFVSSVVEGFQEYREAARRGIEEAGGEPILVNEDFPLLNVSPRNACLDAIDSADIYLAIVGARGGWIAPSGQLVVEEEYEHAKTRKKPLIMLVQKTDRDEEADRLVGKMSEYVDERFRRGFASPQDLIRESIEALRPLIPDMPVQGDSTEHLNRAMARPLPHSQEAVLRLAIAPERYEEMIDPIRLESDELLHTVYEVGHKRSIGLLIYAAPKRHSVAVDRLLVHQGIVEGHHQAESVRVELSDHGLLAVDAALGHPHQGRHQSLPEAFVLAEEEVAETARSMLSFYGGLMEQLDPFNRYQRFPYNIALLNLHYRTLERSPEPRSSYTGSVRDRGKPIVAYEPPRVLGRPDLSEPSVEVHRALRLLVREASA